MFGGVFLFVQTLSEQVDRYFHEVLDHTDETLGENLHSSGRIQQIWREVLLLSIHSTGGKIEQYNKSKIVLFFPSVFLGPVRNHFTSLGSILVHTCMYA